MRKKKIKLSNKKERVVLSDVLPYELPVTFSNRHFYYFLVENGIEIENLSIKWKKNNKTLKYIIKLLFGLNDGLIKNELDQKIELNQKFIKTIPFGYKISHKEKEFRELTLIHPLSQLALVEFYNQYKQLILYYSGISNYSIRYPHKVASISYYKDKTHFEILAHDHEHKMVEEFDKEYENIKTFFVYKKYSNIYKFYESYKYHRCEKKYNKLYMFDISKCFDSIYTHSISWALLNKNLVKDNLRESNNTLGGKFDKFMQNLNYGETNGIIIGPEFSRIFAELILQHIDKTVQQILKYQKPSLVYRRDYEIFRYVDDFFVFFNEESAIEEILQTYRLQLKEFKLYISDSKSEMLDKPLITGITRAKLRISDLLNEKLSFEVLEKNQENGETRKYSIYISSNKLITRFKIILKETGISYSDILNYTLACIDGKVKKLIKIYSEIQDKEKYKHKITRAIIELLDFTFFIYSVSPKVNTTIKLCMIISKVIKFVKIKNNNFYHNNKHLIFKEIYDGIFLVLKKHKCSEHTQVETLYLLIALKYLGKEYRINQDILCQHFGIDLKEKTCNNYLNYLSIVVLLFYIENIPMYLNTKSVIKKHIILKYKNVNDVNRSKTTELTLMLFDLLSCPFLDRDFKNKLFSFYGINGSMGRLRTAIIKYRKYWFTKWSDFDFMKELEAKKSYDVY